MPKRISSAELFEKLVVTQKIVWFMYHRIKENHKKSFEPFIKDKEKNKHANNKKEYFVDTFQLPKYDLRIGNCMDVLKELETNSCHLVLTDPPYFLDGLDTSWKKGEDHLKGKSRVIRGLPVGMKFDPAQGKALQKFISSVASEIKRVLVPGGFFLSFSQPRLSHRMAIGLEDAGFEIRDIYAWHYTKKSQMKAFSQNHFVDRMDKTEKEKQKIKKLLANRKTPQLRPLFDSIIMAQNPKEGTFVDNWLKYRAGLIDVTNTLDGKSPQTLLYAEKPRNQERGHGHMTPKPIKLLEHLIKIFSLPEQVVLDPFLGSGSTAVASLRTGRYHIGIEINKKYMEIAKKRIAKVFDIHTNDTTRTE